MSFVLGVGGLLLLHLYLYWRLVHSTGTGRRWRITGALVVIALLAAMVTAFVAQRSSSLQQFTALHAVGNIWLALMAYLILVLLVGELLRAILLLVRSARRSSTSGDAPRDPRRRLLLSRSIAVAAGVVAVGVTGWGVTQALGPIRVVRTSVTLPRLPAAFQGYRIAVVTDVHLSALSGVERTQRVVDLVNAEQVDVVAVVC
jgi:heme/copper-type cytochrome/quinol oxidase subunit 2